MGLLVEESARLLVRCVGKFEITDSSGGDLTPRGAKARALVALLALAPERRRHRRWIESLLWSDRAPEQASGSLRQALMEVRRTLGCAGDCLQSDREVVSLANVSTDLDRDPAAVAVALRSGRELLESFDVRDEAFEEWLRQERSTVAARFCDDAIPGIGLPTRLVMGALPGGFAGFVGLSLANGIAQMLSQFAFVDVRTAMGAGLNVDLPERGLTVCVEVAERSSAIFAMVTVTSQRTGTMIWSRTSTLCGRDADLLRQGECPTLVFEAVDAALSELGRATGTGHPEERVNGLISRAVANAFSFDGAALRQADRLLGEAEMIWPSGLVSAWRGFVRQIMLVERTETDRERLLAEAEAFMHRAVEMQGTNPVVLALSSLAHVMLDRDLGTGAALSRDALRLGPENPFALAAQVAVYLRAGRPQEALTAARLAGHIASRSRFVHWWEALEGTAAIAQGQFEAAIGHFEAAHARAPLFRPPMRHLVFLYSAKGQPQKAEAIRTKLSWAEPDFSIDRIVADPDYPAATLRQTGLLSAFSIATKPASDV